MALVVSNSSVAAKLKTALYAAIVPAVAVIHALGYDWGATNNDEHLARDAAVILVATAVITLAFAVYAQLKKTTVGEPVALAGSVAGVLAAVYSLFLAFDWGSEGVVTTVFALIAAVLLPFGITVTRSNVTPVANVQANPNVEPQDHFHNESGQVDLLMLIAVAALVAIAVAALVIAF